MSKHTPGPWLDYHDPMSGILYLTDDAGNTIAMTSPMEDDAEAEDANARLIVAAPDMLEALKGMAAMLVADGASPSLLVPDDADANEFANAFAVIEAAIRKAEGRK